MFEAKLYSAVLHELAKSQSKLKILEIAFIRNFEVLTVFRGLSTGEIGLVVGKMSLNEVLNSFVDKGQSALNAGDKNRPVAYVVSEMNMKVWKTQEVRRNLNKNQNLYGVRELVLFRDHLQDFDVFYLFEARFNGKELESKVLKMLAGEKEGTFDNKFWFLALNIGKHLVELIEKITRKNIARLKFHFIVDKSFTLWIINVPVIKLVHPKAIQTYKGLDVDMLENMISLKNEFKGSWELYPSAWKEPDHESTSPKSLILKPVTNIFVNFVSNFLQGRKNPRRLTHRSSSLTFQESESPVLSKEASSKLQTPLLLSLFPSNSNSPLQSAHPKNEPKLIKELKLPNIKVKHSSNPKFSTAKELFPGLQPSPSLSSFLIAEQQRLIDQQIKRLSSSGNLDSVFPSTEKIKRIKKIKKKIRTEKKKKPKLLSPYRLKKVEN